MGRMERRQEPGESGEGRAGAPAEMLPHPWTGSPDRVAEDIAFIHRQLEMMRAAMRRPDADANRAEAREELRANARPWA